MMNAESFSSSSKSMKKHLPIISMIIAQFALSGVILLSKAAISSGIKPSIFVAYRQAIATLVLAPFAFFYHRKTAHPMSWCMLAKLFVASFGLSLSINLVYVAFNYVSATFVMASSILVPVLVFLIAASLRIESFSIRTRHGILKIFGTLLCLSGAMAFAFYKGPPLHSGPSIRRESHNASAKTSYTKEEWIKGALLVFSANLASSIWLVTQAPILKQYPETLRATTLQFGFSCLTSMMYGAFMERNISSWKLSWDIQLVSVVYCGIIGTAVAYTLQAWVIKKKGPVYPAIFSPLSLVVTAIFSTIFLDETLHWGSALGAALLVGGLYSFLWGKNREVLIEQQKSNTEAQSVYTISSKLHTDEESNPEDLCIILG